MDKITQHINSMISRNIPFYIFRLPDEERLQCGCSTTSQPDIFHSLSGLQEGGFVFAPFEGSMAQYPSLYIKADRFIDDARESEQMRLLYEDLMFEAANPEPKDTKVISTQKQYFQQCERIIEGAKSARIQKAILSRIIEVDDVDLNSAGRLFESMLASYSSAFVFLVNIPGQSCWVGASPERLLSINGNQFSTMSLAGTQAWNDGQTDNLANWDTKDKEEQAMVTTFINQLLSSNPSIRFTQSELMVRRAGTVGHLCNLFDGDMSSGQDADWLLASLNPTPAVCGSPKKEALEMIMEVEPHQREYYSGFLGPVYHKGKADMFVNLRSAKLLKDKVHIFVGGGITARSDKQAEWRETNLKANTILNILSQWKKEVQIN